MTNNKHIIGITGPIASGKGTAAAYLEKVHGAANFRYSTMLRDILRRLHIPETRTNIVNMSVALRGAYGEDQLAKTMAEDIKSSSHSLIVIEGIRRKEDLMHISNIPGFTLVSIDAPQKTRHSRLCQRRENEDDATKTFADFLLDHQKPTEITIPEVMAKATKNIDNSGNLAALYSQLDTLV